MWPVGRIRTASPREVSSQPFSETRSKPARARRCCRGILYRYSALSRYDLAREVYDLFVAVCPRVFDVTLADANRARDLLMDIRGLSARDAVHAAVMLNHGVEWIATFDADFDRVGGLRRLAIESGLP